MMPMRSIAGCLILAGLVIVPFWRGYRAGYLKPMLQGAAIGLTAGGILLLGMYLILTS